MKKTARTFLFLLALLLSSPVRPMAGDAERFMPPTGNVLPAAPVEVEDFFLTAEAEGMAINLSKKPCVSEKVTSFLRPEWAVKYFMARVIVGDMFVDACWIPDPVVEAAFFIIFEDGSHGLIPKATFKPLKKKSM